MSSDDKLATAEGFVSPIRAKEKKEKLIIKQKTDEPLYWKKKVLHIIETRYWTWISFTFKFVASIHSLAITGLIVFPKQDVN